MIKTFKSKGLDDLFGDGTTSRIGKNFHDRLKNILDALDAATVVGDMNMYGWDFHPLKGFDPTRYSVHVNGPWCVVFEFENGNACRVDFVQYH